ncbi:MAG TPA: putative folate metabolism gamma-glutamate ligase [Candidatus Moranbacteria bacterium]|nr:putative folate metabolism gamma-glutamate ligase [Candidatus Moranbacteria bacterium]
MIVAPIKTRVFLEGENLFSFVSSYFKEIPENSIIVVTSKIVSLAEKRTIVVEDEKTREKVIYAESERVIPTDHTLLTIKDGMVMSAAGVDESNADGKIILLPKDSYKSARSLRKQLQEKYQLKNLGVLITDSRMVPFRAGMAGVATGYDGFSGIQDYRGAADIFGRKLKVSVKNVADSLAAAAVLVMGEGNEQQPLAIIKRAKMVKFTNKVCRNELFIDIKDDLYGPVFK